MRLPLSWLRDFVAFDGSAEDLAERLIASGFEVEAILRPGAPDTGDNHANFVIGQVVDFGKHPNADRLRLCQVDTGDPEPRQIVCGASNFAAGDTVVVALPGALLPGVEAPLKQAKLRGEASNGMMLSERELGLSDDHDGIIVLEVDGGYAVGSLLRDYVELDETVLDLSVESNRGDCLSVYGMAREVAVLFGLDLAPMPGVEPIPVGGATADLVDIGIDAPDRCTRFTARGFVDVAVGKSPIRARQRLAAAGIRSISNVVDVTNYVMHELGNPLHAYDADRIPGQTLVARLANDGEVVTTLDGRDRELTSDMLVIADADGPSGIAGVMGGAASEIRHETTRVVLESACFERSGIQRTTKALGLRTDGTNHWEKGVNPHLAPIAAVRAAELLVAWSGASMLGSPQDVHAGLPVPHEVRLRPGRAAAVLGMHIDDDEVERILTGLGFSPRRSSDGWDCSVPDWRWLDATREIDLVEEVGRIHGLRHVPSTPPRIPPAIGGLTDAQMMQRRAEDHLAGAGLTEVVTLSLRDPAARIASGPSDAPIVLRNPLSADLSEMRMSLLPGLLEVVRHNRTVGQRDVHIFEFGRVYRAGGEGGLADEDLRLGIVLAGSFGGSSWLGAGTPCDVSMMIAIVDTLFRRLGVSSDRTQALDLPIAHPGRSAHIEVDGRVVGMLGELHPGVATDLGIDGPVAVAEVGIDPLVSAASAVQRFTPLSEYPPVRQDIAVIVDDDVAASALVATAIEVGGPLLAGCRVFDVHVDKERLGTGRVSLGITLTLQALDRTLTDDDADAVRRQIVDALTVRHGAELRG